MFNLHRFIHKYPFETLHEMNLDWLIESVMELAKEINDFEIVNQFTYEGNWDITKQYKKFAIVTVNGTEGYISLQPVPTGVDISNPEYWALIADYTAVIAGLGNRVLSLENTVSDIEGELNKSAWLKGKKVVWYGDSWLTTTGNLIYQFQNKYPEVTVTGRGIGGTMLTRSNIAGFTDNSGYQRILAATDLASFDYIFISYGVNDWQVSKRIMSENPTEYDYNYALKGILDHIKTYYPSCIPVVIFPSYCYKAFNSSDKNGINNVGCNLPGYINNGIDICRSYNVNYINLYELAGVNQSNYAQFMRDDSGVYVHPTTELFEKLADIIYNGIGINGIKCYGEDWSENILLSTNGNPISKSDLNSPISNCPSFPIRQVNGSDTHNLVNRITPDLKTVIHLQGYKANTYTLGIYVDNQEQGQANVRTGITNVGDYGWIDSYIECDNSDLINVALIASTGFKLFGASARLKGSGDATAVYAKPTAASGDITVTSSETIIINGIQYMNTITFDATNDIAAFTDIISNAPVGYVNNADYITGMDATAGEAITFYLYNGKIRNNGAIVNGHHYIIPNVAIKTAI